MSNTAALIEEYSHGPGRLREAVSQTPQDGWDATPVEGKWSIRQVVCHLADAEIIYADRIKRVLAEENPTFFEADPNLHVPALYCSQRTPEAELAVTEAVRLHMLPILKSCSGEQLQRVGVHSLDGPMTVETLLTRITGHIPHHIRFIEEKLNLLNNADGSA